MGSDEPIVGVLELQGAFAEHSSMLKRCGGCRVQGVREPGDVDSIDALVLPGGESTTQAKLLSELGLLDRVRQRVDSGMPVFGTCAGAILLSRNVRPKPKHAAFEALDAHIDRNAYGAQINSFETAAQGDMSIFGVKPLPVVHIRAPAFASVGKSVSVLATMPSGAGADKEPVPVLVRQNNILAATFHPELTHDIRVHQYFVNMVRECIKS